ncbi:protein kinase C delta type-like [Xenopus laevis]|uniref:Protein kinase C delta type-like n=1 Tax=Xenopus laevis TaxID=8355 RepID=A0A8J1KX99_XENLA|nr:protein kinase C delta type-like [Xenopus laevis]
MACGSSPFMEYGNRTECRLSILLGQPCILIRFSFELQDLLRMLLKKNPKERLGCNGNIRKHPFFNAIDWVQLEKQTLPPPSQPEALSPVDFKKTCEEPPSFLESLKHTITSGDQVSLQVMACLD